MFLPKLFAALLTVLVLLGVSPAQTTTTEPAATEVPATQVTEAPEIQITEAPETQATEAVTTPVTEVPETPATEPPVTQETQKLQPEATNPPKTEKTGISAQEAKAAALAHAGLTEAEVSRIEVEKDRERGVWIYEVEFRQGRLEYEYEIHAETGAVLKWEKEYD